MRPGLVVVGALFGAACANEKTGIVAGPPLTIASTAAVAPEKASPGAPSSATAAPTPPPPPVPTEIGWKTAPDSPVVAAFIQPSQDDARIEVGACEQIVVAPSARALAFDEGLEGGDVLLVTRAGTPPMRQTFTLKLTGPALVAKVRLLLCEPSMNVGLLHSIVRKSASQDLAWAGGAMRAHLDVESPPAYVGHLSGTAPVAEHAHESSWEILATFAAAGTFTLAGKDQRLGPSEIVFVPPSTKHSWKPDAGSTLVAVQLYDPPGPEQRFKKLAADAAKH